ncbi:hypothetical protein DFH27DRAFT_609237 [Peziza echinospora]|nr:hypothetical protein DFH27DRAFT_609237 [Peziza echinospora]
MSVFLLRALPAAPKLSVLSPALQLSRAVSTAASATSGAQLNSRILQSLPQPRYTPIHNSASSIWRCSNAASTPQTLPRPSTLLLRRAFASVAPSLPPQPPKKEQNHFTSNVSPPLPPPSTGKPTALESLENQPRLLDRLKAAGQISHLEQPPALTATQRLLRPFLFTLAVLVALHVYTLYWTPPPQDARLFPTIPQSAATVFGLIAINAAVFLLWKVPIPLNWRLLNKYFISVAGLPTAFSMLGCTFSHQSLLHLTMNCFALYAFGSTLCDQIGRANFLAIYLGSGVVSSLASLTFHVLKHRFHVFSLGASGAVAGVIGAYAYFNPDRELMFFFIPALTMKAANVVGVMAGLEIWGLYRGYKRVDHVAHLGGLAWGAVTAALWWRGVKERRERRLKRWWGDRV